MRPSLLVPELMASKTYKKATQTAQAYLGEDMELDFDMMINKPPHSHTETPWHQDAAYWVNLPDKRAVSIWIALDGTTMENGCMWFAPKEQKQLEPHEQKTPGAALSCAPPTSLATPIPLPEGGCTLHDGFTLHYSGGNTTAGHRRGLILNFRPTAMIHWNANRAWTIPENENYGTPDRTRALNRNQGLCPCRIRFTRLAAPSWPNYHFP
jgi:phytanoyl-CoA hydroxylase